jgi:Family of unknown function (DUF5947)
MSAIVDNPGRQSFAALRQFVRKGPQSAGQCELCAAPLGHEHSHLLELDKRRVTCACESCSILFVNNARQRYRRIPREVRQLTNLLMDDQDWNSLLIPIKLAFFVQNSALERIVAQYPSPAGAMESCPEPEYWNAIVERNPVLRQLAPDVEALLVNRLSNPARYYRTPIDRCYRLVGVIRTHWHGFSGGAEVWQQVNRFFHELDAACGGHRA